MVLPPCIAAADTETETETIVNVKDFGAVGDGKTDDRGALLQAFAYAREHLPATVYFPEGEYGLLRNGLYIRLPHGSGNLIVKGDGADKSKIVYLENWTTTGEWFGLRIMPDLPEGASSLTDYSLLKPEDYLHDILIEDMCVVDMNPEKHCWNVDKGDAFTEETHGFGVKYTKNAVIRNCKVVNVGDEALDMTYCLDSEMSNNVVIGSPGAGAAGGAISAGDGCDGVKILNNIVTGSIGTKTNFGIAVEGLVNPVKNIYAEGNIVTGITGNGINIGAPGTHLENIIFRNNTITECTNGIAVTSLGEKTGVVLENNTISHTETGFLIKGSATGLLIDGCTVDDATQCGMRLGGTNTTVRNCLIKNSGGKAVYCVGENVCLENCEIQSSGLQNESVAAVEQFSSASAEIRDLVLTDCRNLTAILGVDKITGAKVIQSETEKHIAVKRAHYITDSEFNRSIYITVDDCYVSGVQITMEAPVSEVAAIYLANAQRATVENCNVSVVAGYAIREVGTGSTENTVRNNTATGGMGFWKVAESSVFENNLMYCLQHSFGTYIYNNDATREQDGTKTRTCRNCPATETVTAEGTRLPYTLYNFDETTGTLTVSGTGPMDQYTAKTAPWQDVSNKIQKIVVEEGVATIGNWAFAYCYNVKEVLLPQTLETIGSNAFYVCQALESIDLPQNVSVIGVGAFYNCRSLQTVSIPTSVTRINAFAFSGCNALTNILYPGRRTEFETIAVMNSNEPFVNADILCEGDIQTWYFDEATGTLTITGSGDMPDYTPKATPWYGVANDVKAIVVAEGITSVGNWAFAYCYQAETVVLPQSLVKIGSNAFYRCRALKEMTIPDAVTVVGSGAFYQCRVLKSIRIPVGVKVINSCTFDGCTALSHVYYGGTRAHWAQVSVQKLNVPLAEEKIHFEDEKVTWHFDGETATLTLSGMGKMEDYTRKNTPWFAYADQIKTVIVEDGITSIGKYAFSYLPNVRNVYIGDTVEQIGIYAFYGNGLTALNLPESVTVIGHSAFAYCGALETVSIPDGVKEIAKYTFTGCTQIAILTGDFADKTIHIGNEPITDLLNTQGMSVTVAQIRIK